MRIIGCRSPSGCKIGGSRAEEMVGFFFFVLLTFAYVRFDERAEEGGR